MKQKEVGSSWHAVKGHAKMSRSEIRAAIYVLLAGFYGSRPLRALAGKSDDDFDPILGLLEEWEEEMLQEKLVYVAIRLRILDDYLLGGGAEYKSLSAKWVVGSLDDLSSGKVVLTLREACNKIVHAELLNWVVYENSSICHEGSCPAFTCMGRGARKDGEP